MSLKESAQEVLRILEKGSYLSESVEVSIVEPMQQALSGSRLFSPEELDSLRTDSAPGRPVVEVTNATTQVMAQEMAARTKVMLLNFASGRNPGGGFLNGAKAQEEDLCRCSGLYNTLLPHKKYYEANRGQSSLLYTDYAIYSPQVPFFKTRGTGAFLLEPFLASVLTMPAPNSGPYLERGGEEDELRQCFERRWANVLSIAPAVGHAELLLGAWGCGAFGGDPNMAAETAKSALSKCGSNIDRVVFAIPGKGKQSRHNLEVFQQILLGE
ncbi:MAG: TIGR02452 family protein [Planctomycetota bacterium]